MLFSKGLLEGESMLSFRPHLSPPPPADPHRVPLNGGQPSNTSAKQLAANSSPTPGNSDHAEATIAAAAGKRERHSAAADSCPRRSSLSVRLSQLRLSPRPHPDSQGSSRVGKVERMGWPNGYYS